MGFAGLILEVNDGKTTILCSKLSWIQRKK
jgi:hypothetical protein